MIMTSVVENEGILDLVVIVIVALLIGISGFGAYVLKRILG